MKLADNAFDRNLISEKLFEALGSVVGVQSISLVGSFCDKQDLSVISDIDTIVVCDNLTEEIFESCIDSVSCLSGSELGFPDREIFVNSSFGPLKFDKPNLIVIHLMIYDTAGHREHVLKSPFTCYDWERSNLFHGKSLREVYPVLRLQPNHFTHARRGLDDYLEDISKGVISYRRYAFDSGVPQEVLDFHSLDSKHKGEYAYHIVKNLVSNYFKMLLGENIVFDQKELIFNWENFLPESVYFIPFYQKLEELKLNRASNYPEDTLLRVSGFLKCFEDSFARHWNSGLKIKFFRHGKTKLNDGSFLGQGRNPELDEDLIDRDLGVKTTFSSPMKRAIMTASEITPNADLVEDSRLIEINYGRAEGMFVDDFKSVYPEIFKAWGRGEDAKFPNGENSADVLRRLKEFLKDLKDSNGEVAVVTHNVVLRCLIGMMWHLPISSWHLIQVPHCREIEILRMGKKFYLNLEPELKGLLTDSFL